MNNKKGLLLILVFFPLWLLGQEMKIKGNVKDDEGSGMLGVSVVVKGTTKGVATDNDGNFELKVNRNDVLVFSSVGYTTQEVKVGKNTHLKVVMFPDVEELVGFEKVAVAYGTADKKSFTGFYGYRKSRRDTEQTNYRRGQGARRECIWGADLYFYWTTWGE